MPETTLFTRLQALIAEELAPNIPAAQIQPDSLLFESGLGLDSVQLIKLIDLIEAEFAVQFTDDDLRPELFHSMDSLMRVVAAKAGLPAPESTTSTHSPQLLPVTHDRPLPLSFAQQTSWQFQQQNPSVCSSNVGLRVQVQGALQLDCLQHCFDELSQRQAILRTYYEIVDGQPCQRIADHSGMQLQVLDWSQLSVSEQAQAATQWMETENQGQAFDLSQLPLWRVHVAKLAADNHLLLFTLHHIQLDHPSVLILLQELAQLYTALSQGQASPLTPLPIQYADYAVWQRARITPTLAAEKVAYWHRLLQEPPAPLRLPFQLTKDPAVTLKSVAFTLTAEQTQHLEQLSQQYGCHIFACVLTAVAATFYPYTDQCGMLLGSAMSNKRTLPPLRQLIGHFAGRGTLRLSFADDPPLSTLLARFHQMALEAFLKQELTYAQLKSILPDLAWPDLPPFQLILNFMPVTQPLKQVINTSKLCFQILQDVDTSAQERPLILNLGYFLTAGKPQLHCLWTYREDMCSASLAAHLATRFHNVLTHLPQQVTHQLSAVAVAADSEQELAV